MIIEIHLNVNKSKVTRFSSEKMGYLECKIEQRGLGGSGVF